MGMKFLANNKKKSIILRIFLLKGGYAMNVVMPLPRVVQVFNEEKLLIEISCCDEELALRMYDFFVLPTERDDYKKNIDYMKNDQ